MLHNNGTTIMVLFNVFLFYFFPSFDRTQKFIFKKKQEAGTEKWTRSPHK